MNRLLLMAAVLSAVLIPATGGFGQDPAPVLPGRPDANIPDAATTQSSAELGAAFESLSAGISLRPPAGCKEVRRALGSDEIVQFVDDQKHWTISVSRTILSKPLPLSVDQEAKPKDAGQPREGMLELSVAQFIAAHPGAEVLRHDTTNISDTPVGQIAARYALGTETRLTQQALVQASETLYFTIEFLSPAPKAPADISQDPSVRQAVDTFNKVLDSVKLLDQTQLVEDKNQRLYRTRAFFVNLSEVRMRNALVPEQWWRLIRNGKDIGYSYVVEEVARDLPRHGMPSRNPKQGGQDGVLIGVRSRTIPDADHQVETESWMWMSMDRKHEIWSSIGETSDKKAGKSDRFAEFGSSDSEVKSVVDPNIPVGEKIGPGPNDVDKKQPPVRQQEIYRLSVTQLGAHGDNKPLERELPPYYLPQALGHILPRVLPRWEPKTYVFASYLTDQRQVALRYVDVGPEQEVTLGSEKVRAIPVKDRIGLEGSATTHYISPEGKYLGSVNPESKVTILPTDRATLEKLWSNPNLTRPGDVEQPK